MDIVSSRRAPNRNIQTSCWMGYVAQKGTEVRTSIDMSVCIGTAAVKKSAVQIEYEETSFDGRESGDCRKVHALAEGGIDGHLCEVSMNKMRVSATDLSVSLAQI
jgi:intracellular sulfur oxidation DsrE/DsrF family protein